MKKIVGLVERSGVMEKDGNKYPWNNVNVYTLEPITENGVGEITQVTKIKKSKFDEYLNKKGLSYSQLLGLKVDFNFDEYGNFKSFEILK